MSQIECAFVGIVGVPPELKTSKAGKAWTALSLRVGDGDGPQWVRAAVFGDMAETAAKLAKGSSVYVEGKLSLNTWTAQDGSERHGLNVAATLVQPLGQIGRRRPASEPEKVARSDWQRPLDRDPAGSRMNQEIPF